MNFSPPPVPYWFQTPKGSDIDLRLFNRGQLSTSSVTHHVISLTLAEAFNFGYLTLSYANLPTSSFLYIEEIMWYVLQNAAYWQAFTIMQQCQ